MARDVVAVVGPALVTDRNGVANATPYYADELVKSTTGASQVQNGTALTHVVTYSFGGNGNQLSVVDGAVHTTKRQSFPTIASLTSSGRSFAARVWTHDAAAAPRSAPM